MQEAAAGLNVPTSKIKGAYLVGKNAILINPALATYDTPIHEFAHIWAKQLMRENPELWKKGRDLLKGSEYAKAVASIPTYKKYLDDGNVSKFWEEVMANAIGKRGAELFNSAKKQNAWNKWMNQIGNWVKNCLLYTSPSPRD